MICLLIALLLWRGKRYVHHSITTAFIAFFLVICFSNLIAYHPPAAIRETEEYFKLMVLFFVIILTVRNENDFRLFIIGFIAIMGIYIGKSLWEFLLNDRHVYRMGIRRLTGIDETYSDPNTFAASIVYSLPFAWALWKSDASKWIRIALSGYGLMSAVAILFTGSRSGMVSLLLFAMLVLLQGKGKKIFGAVALVIVVLSAWQFVPEEYKLRYFTIVDDSISASATASAEGRIEGLRNGIRLFVNSPLYGWGAGNFPYAVETIEVFNRMQSHNLYGQLVSDLGLFGLISFSAICWMIYSTNGRIQKTARKITPERGGSVIIPAMSTACLNTMILLLFLGNFGHNLYRYTWLLIGAILVLGQSLISKQVAETCQFRFRVYQIVLSTRLRKPVLTGRVASRAQELIRQILKLIGVTMLQGRISRDNIGLVVAVPRYISINYLTRLIHNMTSKKILSEFKALDSDFPKSKLWEWAFVGSIPTKDAAEMIIRSLSRKNPRQPDGDFKIDADELPSVSPPASQLPSRP